MASRKTTNRLRAIETALSDQFTIHQGAVARQLIACGRLKLFIVVVASGFEPLVARQLIACVLCKELSSLVGGVRVGATVW